ncbi:MAG: nucleoside recognition domain-containing protein [Lachnospiraceae bacterium]|nr:nucleoside recognition domain-containing protein [Lachnospiraceae bacterium]
MFHYLWAGMLLIGIVWGALHGRLDAVTMGVLDGAEDAVSLGITMLGVMAFWSGILEIGRASGLVDWLAEKMRPALRFLFPNLREDHPAMKHMAVNMIANMLGLGAAATPAGLQAMKALKEEMISEGEGEKSGMNERVGMRNTASKEMCTFLIVNISSLQLIPVTVIAYRSQYKSAAPAAIAGPALLATLISTVTGVVFCKVMDGRR